MTEVLSDENHPNTDDRSPSPQFHLHPLKLVVTVLKSIIKWIKETVHPREISVPTSNETTENQDLKCYLDSWLSSVDKPLRDFSGDIPEWLDLEKFARGRRFAMRNILGLVYAEQLSVVLLMSLPILRRPLIFSGRSDTAHKAFRRYLSTVERLMSWYSQDIWNKDSKAHQNLLAVRRMHKLIDHNMQSCSTAHRNAIIGKYDITTTTPLLELVRADLAPYLPSKQQQKWLDTFHSSRDALFISQLGMTCTQLGFVGLMVLAPGKFGAARASNRDLDDFVYVWYVLGHQLGIDDHFNICAGGYEETRKRCEYIMRHIVLPSLAIAGNDWRHMSQCVIEGIDQIMRQPSFEASIAYSLWALNISTPHISSLISWTELPRVWLFKSVLCVFLCIPGFSYILGHMLQHRLRNLRRRLDAAERTLLQPKCI